MDLFAVPLRLAAFLILALVQTNAKPIRLTISVNAEAPGQVIWSFNVQSFGGSKPSALQWSFSYDPPAIKDVQVTLSQRLISQGKVITCSSVSGMTTCIVWGRNKNEIGDGSIAVAKILTKAGSGSPVRCQLHDLSVASSAGESLPIENTIDQSQTSSFWRSPTVLSRRSLTTVWRHRKLLALIAVFLVLAAAFPVAGGLQRYRRRPRPG